MTDIRCSSKIAAPAPHSRQRFSIFVRDTVICWSVLQLRPFKKGGVGYDYVSQL